jgi:hypothetical protein
MKDSTTTFASVLLIVTELLFSHVTAELASPVRFEPEPSASRETEHPLGHDVALNLLGSPEDRLGT